MTSVTDSVQDYGKQYDTAVEIKGNLWIAFCNVKKEEIYKIEATTSDSSKSQLRRFILLRENLIRDYDLDYIIIDTSPGIRYWSINALAVADTLFLTLKMGDIDVEGTKKLASEIYGSLTKYGTRSFLLFNRVSGYCIPSNTERIDSQTQHQLLMNSSETENAEGMLSKETKMEVISAIPCYCDIQFSRKEFLTVLRYPSHPFTKQLEMLVNVMTSKL